MVLFLFVFFFQAEDGIRDLYVTGVQTCALPIFGSVAAYRDRWSINDHEPLGAAPDGCAIDRTKEWTELTTRLEPEHLIAAPARSEERRVGKECRARGSP